MTGISGENHMLDVKPTDYISAMAAFSAANLTIAFRDVDVRELLRIVEKKEQEIEQLKKELKATQDNYEELEYLYNELKYEAGF